MSYPPCPAGALVMPALAGALVAGSLCWVAQAAWLLVGTDCMRAAIETAVPVQVGRLGSVRLSVNNTTVTIASPTTPATVGHIRRRHGSRAVTRSVTGIASPPTSPVKAANSGPSPG